MKNTKGRYGSSAAKKQRVLASTNAIACRIDYVFKDGTENEIQSLKNNVKSILKDRLELLDTLRYVKIALDEHLAGASIDFEDLSRIVDKAIKKATE